MENHPATDRYIAMTQAVRMLGYSRVVVARLADQGRIGVRQIEGHPPRFRLADVEALIASSTRPARAS